MQCMLGRSIAWMIALSVTLLAPLQIRADVPHLPYTPFTVETDNVPKATISAWYLPAPKPAQGTVFFCHGFRNNKQLVVPYQWIREDLGWNMILFDFRGHGESSKTGLCTLGYYEQWDLKAMVDWADAHHLAKPYLVIGVSMGASIGLRWAGEDPRISGVLAYSPFKTGWDAVHQFHYHGHAMGPLPSLIMHGGFKRLLKDVDVPESVAKRDDLRIWIVAGEHDWFPAEDQRAILEASNSPQRLKRLEIIPGAGHAQQWKWAGNDPLIKDFLSESTSVAAGPQIYSFGERVILMVLIVGAGATTWRVLRRPRPNPNP